MKFIVVISHVISHNLNQICEPFEKIDNFHVINGFFYSPNHKYVINWHFHKQSFANGMWQVFWGGNTFTFLNIYIYNIKEIKY
jgi:hypothetical protein